MKGDDMAASYLQVGFVRDLELGCLERLRYGRG